MSKTRMTTYALLIEAWRNAAGIILFVVWPVAQNFIPRATPLFLMLAVVAAVVVEIVAGRRNAGLSLTRIFRGDRRIILLIALFAGWIAVSLLWSPAPVRGAKDVAVLLAALVFVPVLAWHFSNSTLLPVSNFILVALVAGSVGLILESWQLTSLHDTFLDTNGIFDLNRNATWLLVIACAASGFPGNRNITARAAIIVALLVACAILSSQGEAAKLALFLAIMSGVAACYLPLIVKPLFALMAAFVLAMPLLAGALADDKGASRIPLPLEAHAGHRIALWQGYANLISQNPILGWGAKADRVFGESGGAAKIAADRGYPARITSPHNAALEIWMNQGLIGVSVVALILLIAGWKIAALSTPLRVSAVSMMMSVFAISMTGSAFYQSWWIATITIGFVVWTCMVKGVQGRGPSMKSGRVPGHA